MNIVLNISCSKVWNNNNKFWVAEKKMISCENVVTVITQQLQFVTSNRCEKCVKICTSIDLFISFYLIQIK